MLRKALIVLATLAFAQPASAKVYEVGANGFVLRYAAQVDASPEDVWRLLIVPGKWWKNDQTFSHDAANLSLDARAGGCFCEVLPNPDSRTGASRGGVEHMRVIYIERPRALRMTGALGPLQAGAGTGTLTIFLRPVEGGAPSTQILWEYVYGGFVRGAVQASAQALDDMLGAQFASLVGKLGKSGPVLGARPPSTGEQGSGKDAARRIEQSLGEVPESYEVPQSPPPVASDAEGRAAASQPATTDAPVMLPGSQGFEDTPSGTK